jgi:hypothetical protein
MDGVMMRRHKGEFYDARQQGLDRRQLLADSAQRSVDRQQALCDSRQADLTERWSHEAIARAVSDPADGTGQAALRRMALDLAEDQRCHDSRQALIDQTQAATDAFQCLIDASQAALDATILAAQPKHAVASHVGRPPVLRWRRRSRARNIRGLADECI